MNIPKPSENLDAITVYYVCNIIVQIKTKASDSTFYFRKKTSSMEVEKIISNLNIKKSCQQEVIQTKIITLNKDLIAKFIAKNFNSCNGKGEFPSELKHRYCPNS